MADLSTVVVVQGGCVRLRVSGELSAQTSERFERAVRQYAAKFAQRFVFVDADELSIADEAGAAALERMASEFPGRFRLTGAVPAVPDAEVAASSPPAPASF